MPIRSVTYSEISDITYGDLNPILPGESVIIEWSSGPADSGWVGTMNAPPTSFPFDLGGGPYRITSRVGFSVTAISEIGTVLTEIVVNGTVVGTKTYNPFTGSGENDVFTTGYPAFTFTGVGGESVEVHFTNNTSEDVELGDSETEVLGFVFAEEQFDVPPVARRRTDVTVVGAT